MAPKVWTERNSSGVAWTHCTWCAILEVIVGSGFTGFPLGIYTEKERMAFVGGSHILNFSGGVDRAWARYGVTVVSPAPMSQAQLRAALAIPNRVWAIAGKLANFPIGHRLRRWQPGFLDFHAVGVAVDGAGRMTWLDPLAENEYPGDPVTSIEVELFAQGNYPNDARYMLLASVPTEEDVTLKGTVVPPITEASVRSSTTVTTPKGMGVVKDPAKQPAGGYDLLESPPGTPIHLAPGKSVTVDWKVTGNEWNGSRLWYGCWMWSDPKPEFGYIPAAGCGPLVPLVGDGGFTQADIDIAVANRDDDWIAHLTPEDT